MTEMPIVHRRMNLTEWGLLIALSVLWGGSFVFNGITVRELPSFVIVTCRVGLAAVCSTSFWSSPASGCS